MSPNALKDDPFWGRLAEILCEIGPSDEELDTIRKRIVAQVNASSAPIVLKEALNHQSIEVWRILPIQEVGETPISLITHNQIHFPDDNL